MLKLLLARVEYHSSFVDREFADLLGEVAVGLKIESHPYHFFRTMEYCPEVALRFVRDGDVLFHIVVLV